MKCYRCGTQVADNVRICPRCGAPLVPPNNMYMIPMGNSYPPYGNMPNYGYNPNYGNNPAYKAPTNAVKSGAQSGNTQKSNTKQSKKKSKKVGKIIAIIAVLLIIVIGLSVGIPMATSIYRIGKVKKVDLGMSQYSVRDILGDPYDDGEGAFSDNGWTYVPKNIQKSIDKLSGDFDDAEDFDEAFDNLDKNYSNLEKKKYKSIVIEFGGENSTVTSIAFNTDTKYQESAFGLNYESHEKKQVNNISISRSTFGVGERIDYSILYYTVEYTDGSYRKAYVGNLQGVSTEKSGTVSGTIIDEWGTYTVDVQIVSPNITVISDNEQYGFVSGGGYFNSGDEVTLTATPNGQGRTFVGWYDENGGLLSSRNPYTFTYSSTISSKIIGKFKSERQYTLTIYYDESMRIYLNGSSLNENPYREEITEDKEVKLSFEGINGSGSRSVYFRFWAETGYMSPTVLSEETEYTFKMPARNYTIQARAGDADDYLSVKMNLEDAGTVGVTRYPAKLGDEMVVEATVNQGYVFVGWYENDRLVGERGNIKYSFNFTEGNKNLTAKFIENPIILQSSPEGAGYITDLSRKAFSIGESVTVTADTRNGYTWVGWFENDEKISSGSSFSYTFKMTEEERTLTAKWIECPVAVEKSISSAGTYTGIEKTILNEKVTVTAQTNDGYTWVGWFENNEKISDGTSLTYTFTMTENERTLTAKWIECPVILTQNIPDIGTLSGVEGVTAVGENVTITAERFVPGYIWEGWFENGVKVSADNSFTYTFVMPEQPKTLEARWKVCNSHTYGANHICTKCGQLDSKYGKFLSNNYIEIGSYPQSEVEDTALQSTLTEKAGTLPTWSNAQKWISYRYYRKGFFDGVYGVSVDDYMWYIDIDHNGEKYRGVYFTSYRPYYTTSSTGNSYQDDNGYTTGKVYWFKWEPIKWRILQNSDGEVLIFADMLLDSQQYYHDEEEVRTIDGKTVYANNYAHSDIRAWLNDNFYNAAFTTAQKELIKQTLVDNSVSTTGFFWEENQYVCENTNDNVFLLSHKDVFDILDGFSSSEDGYTILQKKPTAYAQCQGAYTSTDSYHYIGNGWWWLRSPDSDYSFNARYVSPDGDVTSDYVHSTSCGVCPALKIALGTM